MKRSWLLLLLVLGMILGGCGAEKDSDIPLDREDMALVIIAGKHANANNFSERMMEQAEVLLRQAVDYEKNGFTYTAKMDVTLIVSDGKPRTEELTIGNGAALSTSADDKDLFVNNVESMVAAVCDKLTSDEVRAKERGVDLHGALNQARKILRMSSAKQKRILILDTGICTEGKLDMRKLKLQEGSLDDVMGRIDPDSFPDLDGIGVTFLGLGNVSEPQKIDSDLELRLEEFWTEYLENRCGATLMNEIIFAPDEGEALSYNEDLENPYPYVPTVDFTVEEPEVDPDDPTPPVVPPITLFSAELGFKANSADFRNEADAKKVIEGVTETLRAYFEQNPEKVVYIVGSIAKVDANEGKKPDSVVSQSRAQRIYDILVNQFGFEASRFAVIDAGTTEFTWRNAKEFEDGIKNPANQELNRLVALITETDTEHVQELIDAGEI